ncbi:MAG: hypothetical protein M0P16_13405 [Syntrophales bacterium]|nr:hypothetical protein [Syntrophales bacterium]
MKKAVWRRFAFALVIVVISSLTSACGMIALAVINNSYESLAGTRKDVAYSGPAFQKIIVIGLIKNGSTRIAFENAFMGQFIEQGVNTAIGSIDLPDADSLRNKSLVEKVIQEGSFDGVITVEAKNIADNETSQWLKTWVAIRTPGADNLFEILSNADKSPPVTSENIRFEVSLWDGKAAKQVWAGTTIAIDKHEMLRETHTAAQSTVKTLMKAKLLRPTL